MDCMCPACRGLNDERYDESETETLEVEVEVTFRERVKLTISVSEHDQEEIDEINQVLENMYVGVEVEDWRIV